MRERIPSSPAARTAIVVASLAALGIVTSAQAAEYARVLSSTPVVAQVGVPQRECVEEQRVVPRAPSGAGALVGAIVGGVVGNQIGHGAGRALATGVGAVTGAAVGNHVETDANGYASAPVTRCRTVTGSASRVIGYDVVYEYNGQRYTARTAADPGSQIAIDVRPAGDARPPAAWQPVPPAGSVDTVPHTTYRSAPVAVPPTYVETLPPQVVEPAVVYRTVPAPVYYDGYPYYNPVWPAVVGATVGIGLGYWGHRHWHHDGGRRYHHRPGRAWR